jgi:hypothetical protein
LQECFLQFSKKSIYNDCLSTHKIEFKKYTFPFDRVRKSFFINLYDEVKSSQAAGSLAWVVMTFTDIAQQQMQAQHLPHHPHGPPIPLTPHPAGLQPPISASGASSLYAGAFPPGFPGMPPHLAALKDNDKGETFMTRTCHWFTRHAFID